MKHRFPGILVVCLALISSTLPASAGGWVIVELIEPVPVVAAGEPVTIDVRVLQHGQTPFSGGVAKLAATNRETSTSLSVDGAEIKGKEGEYRFEVTFPVAGKWKWHVSVEPFPGMTAFPTLSVSGAVGTPRASEPVDEEIASISITDGGYSPSSVKVPAGSIVEWTNEGVLPHQVVSSKLSFDNSPMLQPGETYRFTVQQPGTIEYFCGPHPDMLGTIGVV